MAPRTQHATPHSFSISSGGFMIWMLLSSLIASNAFTAPRSPVLSTTTRGVSWQLPTGTHGVVPLAISPRCSSKVSTQRINSLNMVPYSPPEDAEIATATKIKLPTPKIGDVVRYFDVDGGRLDGQVLVGKISLIQAIIPSSSNPPPTEDGQNKWLVEITEMEDVGDGYYAEYPSRKRRRSALRKLEDIAPLPASFVRTEDAFKIPMERGTNRPMPSHPGYDLIGYEGPLAVPINQDVVQADGENYGKIKFSLLKNAAIAGIAGTILADLIRGTEDAIIYGAGALAGVLYLFFLGIKTDTVGSADAKLGSNVSNLRFVFPVLVLLGVALNNVSGEANPVSTPGIFSTVTPEQFGAAMIGFLTYRVPLFLSQLTPVLSESATSLLPGSAGMAMQMAADAKKRGVDISSLDTPLPGDDLTTVFLVSGPEGVGKTTLVKKLLEEDTRFVEPILLDRVADGANFEKLELREEFLQMDPSGRYGLTKEGILKAGADTKGDSDSVDGDNVTKKVVIVDADVDLAKKLTNLSGARLVGVWIGLDSIEKFETRLNEKFEAGLVPIPEDESKESVLRSKVRQVVADIEFGVVSGIFEFTILNEDLDDSMKQLKDAAEYCFK